MADYRTPGRPGRQNAPTVMTVSFVPAALRVSSRSRSRAARGRVVWAVLLAATLALKTFVPLLAAVSAQTAGQGGRRRLRGLRRSAGRRGAAPPARAGITIITAMTRGTRGHVGHAGHGSDAGHSDGAIAATDATAVDVARRILGSRRARTRPLRAERARGRRRPRVGRVGRASTGPAPAAPSPRPSAMPRSARDASARWLTLRLHAPPARPEPRTAAPPASRGRDTAAVAATFAATAALDAMTPAPIRPRAWQRPGFGMTFFASRALRVAVVSCACAPEPPLGSPRPSPARRRAGARVLPRRGRGADRAAADRRFGSHEDARRRHRHGRPADVAADADPGDDGRRHARADRAHDQRQRQRGRAQVPAEPARQEALHRRLQPRHPVEPRFRHRQQRTLGRLRRRHAALQLPRQRRRRAELSAALGHGDAGRDRSRRRDVRAVLGRVSGQLGRRGGRLHDPHAEGSRGPRQGRLHQPAVRAVPHRRELPRLGDERLGRQPERRPGVVAELRACRQPQPAAHVRDAAGEQRRRRHGRHTGQRRRPRCQQRRQPVVRARHRHRVPDEAGPLQGQGRLRHHADDPRDLRPRPVAEHVDQPPGLVPARRRRQRRLQRADQHRRPRLHRRAGAHRRRLRGDRREADPRHARPGGQEPRPGRVRLGGRRQRLRLRQGRQAAERRRQSGPRRALGRRRHARRRQRHRLDQPGAARHLAAARRIGRAHRRFRRPARPLPARLPDLDRRRATGATTRPAALASDVRGKTALHQRLGAGRLGVRAALEDGARRACRGMARRRRAHDVLADVAAADATTRGARATCRRRRRCRIRSCPTSC